MEIGDNPQFFRQKWTILSPYISVNTHTKAILSGGNDLNHKNNSEKLLYMLKKFLLMYFKKSKWPILSQN